MKQFDDILWWKYLDGECTAEEINQIEQLIEADPIAKEEFLLRKTLQQKLSEDTLAEPNFNFANNVMNALPDPQHNIVIEPLIKPLMKKVFFFLLFAFIMSVFIFSSFSTITPVSGDSKLMQIISSFTEYFSVINPETMRSFGIIVLGCGSLFLFDLFLKRRYNSAK